MQGQRSSAGVKRIVVEGCGQWAMQYFNALKGLAAHRDDLGVSFTFDSTFGFDPRPGSLYSDYLPATQQNVEKIAEAGFACVDVEDSLNKGCAPGRQKLPQMVDVVFIVTPDRTHCDVAEYWLDRARWIFVEKPFDVSTARIDAFLGALARSSLSQVRAVDHYFVRCNVAAEENDFFLRYLLPGTKAAGPPNDIESFEFCMTEPPARDKGGNYDPAPLRKRALSSQEGAVFDMGSHALPVMLPFIDPATVKVMEVWAGVCQELRGILFQGAESFSQATVQCMTRPLRGKPSRPVSGTITVGKDIGSVPQKYLRIVGPGGGVRFDLVNYRVYHEGPNGQVQIAALHRDWVNFFVKEVVDGRIPAAVEMFKPGGARQVIRLLEEWRLPCQHAAGSLQVYSAGAGITSLINSKYKVL